MYNKRMNLNHKNIYKIEIKHDMSYQNTSYDTVYKDYYQYNITMCFFCCNCVSENKIKRIYYVNLKNFARLFIQ